MNVPSEDPGELIEFQRQFGIIKEGLALLASVHHQLPEYDKGLFSPDPTDLGLDRQKIEGEVPRACGPV